MGINDKNLLDEIGAFIKETFNVDFKKRSRRQDIVMARNAAISACRERMTSLTLGEYFEMNHATILHHKRNHSANYRFSKTYRLVYDHAIQLVAKSSEELETYINTDWKKKCDDLRDRNAVLMAEMSRMQQIIDRLSGSQNVA